MNGIYKKAGIITGIAGYHAGKERGKEMVRAGKDRPEVGADTIAGAALLPGGIGYTVGKRVGYDRQKRKDRKEGVKRKSHKKTAGLGKALAVSTALTAAGVGAQGLGYHLGKSRGKEIRREGGKDPGRKYSGKDVAGAILPGGLGYQVGKRVGYDKQTGDENYKKSKKKKKK